MNTDYKNLLIQTESDVEQKFIIQLLTTPFPNGLGYSTADFKTKVDIRKIHIGKGQNKKLYLPDYIIILNGIPSIVIEAKAPNEALNEAQRESRLYATEINSQYPTDINPCKYFLVTNGKNIILGYWDSDKPLAECSIATDLNPANSCFSKITEFISKDAILKHSTDIWNNIRKGSLFFKPIHMLGGKTVIGQTVGENSFGVNISLEYKYLFNPESPEERDAIAKNAYVASKRRISHVDSIDRIIKAAVPPSQINSREIQSSDKPNEIISEISNQERIKNELCLLIGSVGSGKSTFTDYLRTVALPKDLSKKTQWVNINLNNAPLAKDKIYEWVVLELIKALKNKDGERDFDALETLKALYRNSLMRVEKGRAALFPKDSPEYLKVISDELSRLQNSSDETLKALIEFICTSRQKLLIVVFDNCDKRNREDQLLMFEVASWLKKEFVCSIFLPLRDSTYDLYCNEPPLDTVIKDLVFRIDPPSLERVIYERLNFALRENEKNQNKFFYTLSNGVRVDCERNEVSTYFRCIISSIFQNQFLKRIITGLAGRNIRKGIEIILEFCKSGHITEDQIMQIRFSSPEFQLPHNASSKILLRRKRLYYDDEHSFVRNLFCSDKSDPLPNPFTRISILLWLKKMYREYGPNKTKGYHKVLNLVNSLQSFGHQESRILIELETLLKSGCILSESLDESIQMDDLITITSSGFIHLDLLRNVYYLGSVAEDTFFRENQIAKKIKDNMTGESVYTPFSYPAFLSNSKTLIDYMENYYKTYFLNSASTINSGDNDEFKFIQSIVDFVKTTSEQKSEVLQLEQMVEDYPPGTNVDATVVSIQNYGIFVNFGLNGNGLIHISKFESYAEYIKCLEIGDWVKAEILNYSREHSRFHLRLISLFD